MHPQIQQGVNMLDGWMGNNLTANQYESLRDLEKKTGQPKAVFFSAFLGLVVAVIYGVGGMKLISDLFGFVYPAYTSFKAIESSDPTDDTQWLTYWVVFSLFSIVETAMSVLVTWIPFYYMIKLSFIAWLIHPKFMGAGLVYKQVVKPFVMPHLQALEQTKPQKKEE